MKIGLSLRVMAIGLAGALLSAAGCATYTPVSKRYSEFGSGLRADLPKGWLWFTRAKDGFTITKDGLRLEKITIKTTRVGAKLKGTDRVYTAGMMPHEAADLSVGLVKIRQDLRNCEVQKIDAVQIAGREGYQVDAGYVDENGLHKRIRLCGALAGKHVCELAYEAAEPVYFQKYESCFRETVSSVRIGR